MLAEAGIDLSTIMKRVGHDGPEDHAADLYARNREDAKGCLRESESNLFGDLKRSFFARNVTFS
jgi:hypothetical protein